MQLREYQQRAIDQLYAWFESGKEGHPVLVLPTGAGKSVIIAQLCHNMLTQWPGTRVLMLTHVKELIEQNYEKLLRVWPRAPAGVYSASIGVKKIGEPITFAGIQSVAKKPEILGHIDIVLIDECHLVSHKDEGAYRSVIAALEEANPAIRVIGLTATPYRLGHGYIDEGEGLFDDRVEPVSILELVEGGYLSPLRSKLTNEQIDTSGIRKRGGEFVESELGRSLADPVLVKPIVEEVISIGQDRKSWLFFCAGVKHAEIASEMLNERGIPSACVTGAMTKRHRETVLNAFKRGDLRAVTNANVLTTGFDHPEIDLIAMLRPTMSPGLYVQMAGRGMRVADGKADCLVLDFAGNVGRHGPITDVQPPKKKGGGGDAPVKFCPSCDEIVHAAAKFCPACGHEFVTEVERPKLQQDDIMKRDDTPLEKEITAWHWAPHTSKTSGYQMVRVSYFPSLTKTAIHEYFPITHPGQVGARAIERMHRVAEQAGVPDAVNAPSLPELASALTKGTPPQLLRYRKNGKFHDIIERVWHETADA